jgi:POT family proton-dependent oligopeptide transporter
LNSLFIVVFAPFSRSGGKVSTTFPAIKVGLGLSLLGLGFGFLAYGSMGDVDSVIRVSMFWLIAAYLFHTLGELCISPVGLCK